MTTARSCSSCGAYLDHAANFCRRCGTESPRAGLDSAGGPGDHSPSSTPLGYQPHPPPVLPENQSALPWVAIAAGATTFVLVVGVIVALALSSQGSGGAHAATVLTVTAPVGVGSPNAPQAEIEASRTPPRPDKAGAEGPDTENSRPVLAIYHGKQITAEVPSGWHMLEDEAQKPGYIESKWQSPTRPSDTVLIDASPAADLTLEQDAAPVHKDLQGSRGYEEVQYGPGDLSGVASWMWIFRVSGDERVDYFFNRCTLGFGVLGSTTPRRFEEMRATFRAVAQSAHSDCG